MRETHSATKFVEFLEGKPAFKTVIEIGESGKWRIHDKAAFSSWQWSLLQGSRPSRQCLPLLFAGMQTDGTVEVAIGDWLLFILRPASVGPLGRHRLDLLAWQRVRRTGEADDPA